MYEYRCNIVKVVDGDTVDVDIDLGFDVILKCQRVRLYGIDAPESRTRDLDEKKFGTLTKEYVHSYFHSSIEYKLVTMEYNAKGKFGRILGDFVNRDGISLCEKLIELRYAVPYYGQSKEQIQKLHEENRRILIQEGVVR